MSLLLSSKLYIYIYIWSVRYFLLSRIIIYDLIEAKVFLVVFFFRNFYFLFDENMFCSLDFYCMMIDEDKERALCRLMPRWLGAFLLKSFSLTV